MDLEKNIEDQEIIRLAQNRPAFYEAMYKKYWKPLYKFFFFRLKDVEQASDYVQDTFLRAFQSLQTFRHRGHSYLSYLRKIARNLLVDHFRRAQDVPIERAEEIPDKDSDRQDERLDAKLLWSSMSRLKPDDQLVLVMFYREQKSIREMATVLGRTENAVKLQLSRARRKLRDASEFTQPSQAK